MDRAWRIGDPIHTSLQGIAEKAKSHAKYWFRNLYGMLNEELLTDCWRDIRQEAAYGIDEVSAQEYEQHLGEHIRQLVERLKRKSYRAKLVRRHYIPKENGKRRPCGMSVMALEPLYSNYPIIPVIPALP
jgi:RNA-directed DNA polymerase